jgi:protein-S-isoprenylcysteine O-methyltransferase Ste14
VTAPPRALPVSRAEQSAAARLGAVLFRHRGWLPVPFVLVPVLAPSQAALHTTVVGLALMAIGEAWRLWGVATAGTVTRRRSRIVQHLVTHGPFSCHRNPLYCGNLLLWMGVITISGVLWFLPVALVLFAVEYSFIVRYEEGVLESLFGEEYLAYKAETPRWVPRGTTLRRGPYRWAEAWRSERSTFVQFAVILGVLWAKAWWG